MNIEYDLIYSDRRTIGITVERDRRIVVRAPKGALPEVVKSAVAQKRYWIWQKLNDPRKYTLPRRTKEFVSGESFFYLGQIVPLELIEEPLDGVRFDGSRFELPRSGLRDARQHLSNWYQKQARIELPSRIAGTARSMGITVNRVAVRDMRYRWGSCSPSGTLSFNWRIVQAPVFVVNYVVAHELAHVLESHHGPEFWNIVGVHAPAWERARSWLRAHGAKLEW